MKKILGLDLGTASIGWALVNKAENAREKSSIIKVGSRIIHYGDNLVKVDKTGVISSSLTPEEDFISGKGLSPNAGRTKQRSARRNLQRYKLRRANLIEILKENKIIANDFVFCEEGNATTFRTYKNRALAAKQQIPIDDFVRVLFMINKKRGYKSSRKTNGDEDGQLIDGMSIALKLYKNGQTPGQFVLELLNQNKTFLPDFYRSDIESELEKIWSCQKQFYPELLTEEFKTQLRNKGKQATSKLFLGKYKIYTADNKGVDKKKQAYQWRVEALNNKLGEGELAFVIAEVNGELSNSSGYLGAISDRSKELHFNKETVGENLYKQLVNNPHTSLKKQIFYRQDYLDEFNTIWEAQAKFYKELTEELKAEIRDVIIFYQRRLKSQKGLLAFCEFESKQIEVEIDGKKKIKTRGLKVIPKSSPLFQEFKIWQILNNIQLIKGKETFELNDEQRQMLSEELEIKAKLNKKEVLRLLLDDPSGYDLNYKDIEGNRTNAALYEAYQKIAVLSGHQEVNFSKLNAKEIKEYVYGIFETLGINTKILNFDSGLEGSGIEKQAHVQLWHLLYSFEGDNTREGNKKLLMALKTKFGFEEEYAKVVANIPLQKDYGSLSAKAIRKILPHLKAGFSYGGRKSNPEEPSACIYAGYDRHSKASLTREEKENKGYKERLDVLPKNKLRNPIVEKILNQTINVVNTIIDEYGKPCEIRVELARELKKSAEERKVMSESIAKTTIEHETYTKILRTEFGLPHVSRNDLIRYKLYLELKNNGYRTLYSNTYIAPNKLFTKDFDIEHILPKAKIFDDSFSNKTLELRSINLEKKDMTAYDFVLSKYGTEELALYEKRVDNLYSAKLAKSQKEEGDSGNESKNADKRISKTKRDKLLMPGDKIPGGFIDRELRNTQYIVKKAKELLEEICEKVNTTTGSITDRLREDWQLVDVLQELNWEKYKALGLTEEITNRDGKVIRRIKDWSKRNDHRHHAMDAITVAFTKHEHVQYLNNLNARSDKSSSVYAIEKEELYRDEKDKLLFKPPIPIPELRREVKKQLENTLISFKPNNKIVTKNKNKIKGKEKPQETLTPRGQLHLETIYGRINRYETNYIKVGASLTIENIAKVANKRQREALLDRLAEFNNDPKKAFTGKNAINKNPIYLNEEKTKQLTEKVKIIQIESVYTIKKEITPDLKIEKVVDVRVRRILEERLKAFNNDAKAAFTNLDEYPIWLNIEKGIKIKRVTISGISNAVSLRNKRDHRGIFLLDPKGSKVVVDFVNTGGNHHVAIYKDENGDLQDRVVSFYEAVERARQGLPVVDRDFNNYKGWQFLFTMKQNECFVFPNEKTGFNPKETDLLDIEKYHLISPNLFRVQKFSKVPAGNSFVRDYVFRHHLETTLKTEIRDVTFKKIQSVSPLENMVKVQINHIGKIVKVGE